MTNFIKLLDAAAQTAAVSEAAGRMPIEHIDMMWSTLVTGLVVVFLILLLLVFVLWTLGKVMNIERKPKKTAKSEPRQAAAVPAPAPAPIPVPEAVQEVEEDDDEIIAVIAAAIAAYGERDGKQYKIASVKRKEKAVRSNWSAAGVAENTRPF